MSRPKQQPTPGVDGSFAVQLRLALEHFTEPEWLGTHSPLAQPYVLGQRLLRYEDATTPRRRGQVLQMLLLEACAAMAKNEKQQRLELREDLRRRAEAGHTAILPLYVQQLREYLEAAGKVFSGGYGPQLLLYWRYLNPPPSEVSQRTEYIAEQIGISPASYFNWTTKPGRQLEVALAELGALLLRTLKPALRLESPLPTSALIGRARILQAARDDLAGGGAGALTGPGGIGKSSLGATLAASFAPRPIFWFTCCPGLNDNLASLLFELGLFLSNHGAGGLWGELITGETAIKPDKALTLLRYDLSQLQTPPVLCFDDVDLLLPEVADHALMLTFFERMAGEVVRESGAILLLMGHQVALEHVRVFPLPALTLDETREFAQARLGSGSDAERAHQHTRGNPRLLRLLELLYKAGETLDETLAAMPEALSLHGLLVRFRNRLSNDEYNLWAALSVFRRSSPRDAWERDNPGWRTGTLQQLIARELVLEDGQGGVAALPALRLSLYNQLEQVYEQRTRTPLKLPLHLDAAKVRAARGEAVAAVYHYLAAEQPQFAVRELHLHFVTMINQGQSNVMLKLLNQVSPAQLADAADQERLRWMQAQLQKFAGEYAEASRLLRATPWTTRYLQQRARRLEAEIADLKENFEQALSIYETSLVAMRQWIGIETILTRRGLARVAMRQIDLDRAWREAQLARYEVEEICGEIEDERGNYHQAEQYYINALVLAEQLGHTYGRAKTRNHLAKLYAFREEYEQAYPHAESACELFERLGIATSIASAQVNLALVYNQAGLYEQAAVAAAKASDQFEQLGERYGYLVAAQNLAEAHVGLRQLEQAEQYGMRVIGAEGENTFADGLRIMGVIRTRQGRWAEAEEFFHDAIHEAMGQNRSGNDGLSEADRYIEAYARRDLGEMYQLQGNAPDALVELERSLNLFVELELSREAAHTQALIDKARNSM